MLTNWPGFGMTTDNLVATDVLFPYVGQCQLSDTPGTPFPLALPPTAQAIQVWVNGGSVQMAIDVLPTFPPLIFGSGMDFTEFAPGLLIMPNTWQGLRLPEGSTSHTAYFISRTESLLVTIVLFLEG